MVVVTVTVLLVGVAAAAAPKASIVDQLAGSWSLASRVTSGAKGKVIVDPALAQVPQGVLIYDHYGHVTAQLSRRGRTVEMLAEECRAAEKVKDGADYAGIRRVFRYVHCG